MRTPRSIHVIHPIILIKGLGEILKTPQQWPGDWWTKSSAPSEGGGNGFRVCLFPDKGRLLGWNRA
ncbi:unnamed protein product [Fusarium venenatum]|uniref:Uncharacterized protein n=1 Tax=Fusarium venenatum TaxID=56646 RepID=A0A2L2SU33_9HYPO|nr:uncharacterized protein FVRRES_05330 [Fusarium venenatum]CEI60894.1 unnamed protein product [Fusarium venenatum]